jgi:hypothetical protein
VDQGNRVVDTGNPDVYMVHRGTSNRVSEQGRRQLTPDQAIKPIIGHLKADQRMDRAT